jgi:hypothetical protein
MMMHVMMAAKHDGSGYFGLDAAVKRRRAARRVAHHPSLLAQAFRPTTSSSAGAISRDVELFEAFSQ